MKRMYEGKLTTDEPSWFKKHSASCLADFSRYSKRLILPASFWALILLQVLKKFAFRMTSVTFPASSEQMSSNPWRDKNPLWLLLTNHPCMCMKWCWVDVFTSNTDFFMLSLLTFTAASVIAFCVPLRSYFRNRLSRIYHTIVSFLAALCP